MPNCATCGHSREHHDEEPPYACWHTDGDSWQWESFDCDCEGFSYEPSTGAAPKPEDK
jgi:hypothetical protein